MRSFSETDFRPDMQSFTVPTIVIHGDADATVPIDKSGRRTAQMIPAARLLEYEGGPHAVFFSHKDRLVKDLYDFVTS